MKRARVFAAIMVVLAVGVLAVTAVLAAVGDGGAAIRASLAAPRGVAVDASGNLFIADRDNHRVRRVDAATKVITTVAGDGASGFSGDGGPATRARLRRPGGVAVDASGNLFIADTVNHRVRRVDASTGLITTVVGTGDRGSTGDGGPAGSASLNLPQGVAVDGSGNLLIVDTFNHRVRRVDASTGVITTVAGDGTGGFSGDGGPSTSASLNFPRGVTVDGSGNLFIADFSNQRIRRVDASTGVISTVAGDGASGFSGDGGPATRASLNSPRGVAVDASGNLFIADTLNHRVRRVDASTGTITTVAGTGKAGLSGDGGLPTNAGLNLPFAVAVDGPGNLFIADTSNNRIRRVDASTGVITTVAGGFIGDGGLATSASLNGPLGVAVDAPGNLFIADFSNQRIRRVDGATGIITTVAGDGASGFSRDGGPAISASLSDARGVAVDASGNLFIADTGNNRVRRVDASTGIITTVAGDGTAGFSGDGGPATSASLRFPAGTAVDPSGNLFIADGLNNRIRRVDAATGTITTVAGNGAFGFSGDGGPATDASLRFPRGVAVDASGNLLIADASNHRIRRVDASTGVITTVAGDGGSGFSGDGGPATSASLNLPAGVAVDALGNLFIADTSNHRVRRVDASTGVITTVAGDGLRGFSGDGGPATSASLRDPFGVAVDGSGNLVIADFFNHRVRRVDGPTGVITTVAGDPSGILFIADRSNDRIRRVGGIAAAGATPTPTPISSLAGPTQSSSTSLGQWGLMALVGLMAGVLMTAVLMWRVRRRRATWPRV